MNTTQVAIYVLLEEMQIKETLISSNNIPI
jgi:hypothetical protein